MPIKKSNNIVNFNQIMLIIVQPTDCNPKLKLSLAIKRLVVVGESEPKLMEEGASRFK